MTQTDDLGLNLDDDAPPPTPAATPFAAPTSIGGGLPPLEMPRPASSYGPRQPNQPRRTGTVGQYHSLESMYGAVPELGTDQARLRVERVEPKWVLDERGSRIPVAGVIGILDSMPSMGDFANQFGGRKFRVYAERLTEDKTQGGEPRYVDVAVAEFEFPLDPNLDELPIVRGDDSMDEGAMSMSMGGTPYNRFSPSRGRVAYFQQEGGGKPQDILEAVRTGAAFAREAAPAPHNDTSTLEYLSNLSQAQAQAVREFSDRQSEMLQRQLEEKDRAIEALRSEMREHRERPTSQGETLSGIASVIGAMRGSAGEQETSVMRQAHEREIARLTQQFDRDKESMRSDFDRQMTSMRETMNQEKSRWTDRERDMERNFEREKQMARDEMERRENAAKRDAEREVAGLKQSYELQIATLRTSFEQQLKMQEAQGGMLGKQIESSAAAEIRVLTRDVATLTAANDSLKREAEELRSRVNKTPIEAIKEAHELSTLTGMIKPTGESGPEEPKSNVDKIVDALAGGLESSAPTIFASLGGIAQGLVNRNAPAKPQQGTVTVQNVQHNPPRFADDDAAPLAQLTQAEEEKPKRRAQPPAPPPQAQTQPPPPQQEVAPADLWAGFAWTGLEPDVLYNVCSAIEETIAAGGTPADAKTRLVGMFGPATAQTIVSLATADKIMASIASSPATQGSRMNSSKGRKFIRELWAEMQTPVEEPTEVTG